MSKSAIAIELSKLQSFKEAKAKEEQYVTDPEIAAEVLWFAKMQGDIEDKNKKKKLSSLLSCFFTLGLSFLRISS